MINIIYLREIFIKSGKNSIAIIKCIFGGRTIFTIFILFFDFCVLLCRNRKRYSPEKTDGERELEDLRSRLLSKRSKQDIERKIEEHQMNQRK